jgi:hypothetical protein
MMNDELLHVFPFSIHNSSFRVSVGEIGFTTSAEGATAQETLRQKNRLTHATLESDATRASAEGITLSGKNTDGQL